MFMCVVNLKSVNKLDLTWKQSFLIPSREAWLWLDRESNTEKRKRFNLNEIEKMFVIKRVENVGFEAILITYSKFVIVYNIQEK